MEFGEYGVKSFSFVCIFFLVKSFCRKTVIFTDFFFVRLNFASLLDNDKAEPRTRMGSSKGDMELLKPLQGYSYIYIHLLVVVIERN